MLKLVALGSITVLAGCGTSINVVCSPNAHVGEVHTAHLVQNHTPPNDMDAKMQAALAAQDLQVTVSASDADGHGDLLVKYNDHWNWDMAMYLHSLELQVYDGKTQAVLATSRWSDGAMHGFRDSGKAAADLVRETFVKLGIPTKPPAS